MFRSFFPRPALFFSSFAFWALASVLFWFMLAQNFGQQFSVGQWVGYGYPVAEQTDQVVAEKTPGSTLEARKKEREQAKTPQAIEKRSADNFWFYQYLTICYLAFVFAWMFFSPHKWARWSVAGSAIIIFVTWYQVQLDVQLNIWFGSFYDTIQRALGKPGSVTMGEYYGELMTFGSIAVPLIIVAVMISFYTSHYVFRWRTAMNDYYMSKWAQLRQIEGASQRVQEDTKRFAAIMESLGVRLIDAVMTLIAFLPILWGLSVHVKEVPILGEIPQPLVVVAILWSVLGTGLLAAVGIKLPGLEFRNQRVEAAYRKELVMGEDNAERAAPPTVRDLFSDVRRNYFRLYFHYMYFNVAKWTYLQIGVLVPYIALAPTIVAGGFTLGIMQQIARAFGRVESSFQFLVHSWSTIVELISIYKRLSAFEAAIEDKPLPKIDRDFSANQVL